MDSINKNQPEINYEDLIGGEGLKKMKALIEKASSTCFFCTNMNGNHFTTRPMAVQKTDEEGNLWFLSAIDSHKNEDIKQNPAVQLLFQGSPHSDFLSVYGTASISQDKAKIKELWEPIIKTWFTEGVEDPRITVIKVEPTQGYYWDTKHAQVVSLFKRLVGAAIGKTLDDSVEGTIKV
jgi:general stress protein 26